MKLTLYREDLKEEYQKRPISTISESWKFKDEVRIIKMNNWSKICIV